MQPDKKYLRPPFILAKIINPLIITFNLVPVLTVKGRKSGKWIKVPVTPLEYKEETYLVAPRGETQWARNLRKNDKGQLTIKGKTKSFQATEISGNVQKEVVTEYQKKVPAVKSQFDTLPDPKDHPTFKLQFTN
jgi:deazaflavin-dependent oxidoreductase (nitroreductase family)